MTMTITTVTTVTIFATVTTVMTVATLATVVTVTTFATLTNERAPRTAGKDSARSALSCIYTSFRAWLARF